MKDKLMNKMIIIFFTLISSCAQPNEKSNSINIATSANMQFAMKVLSSEFTEQTNTKCHLIISSSGKLTAQIKEGAPFDIFVSADMKYPTEIYKYGLAISPPKIYAYGKLILWSINNNIKPSLELLTKENIKHIALANPKTAPYGIATKDVLKHYHLFNKLEDKLVFGESISQTNHFITSQSAELGFTSMSVVMSSQMRNKGNWIEIDSLAYSPIEQGIVVIKKDKRYNKDVNEFYDFLFSKKAKEILINYGYYVN